MPQSELILTGLSNSEDAAVVRFPGNKALVQSLDFFTPIVNDPYKFGQIAAANSLSDIYAMGADPFVVMNIVCFPMEKFDITVLREILQGGLQKIKEAEAFLVGGHSVQDPELKYGLSVTGMVDPNRFATNSGLSSGDALILTKPVGSGVLATAVKADWDLAEEMEEEIYVWASRLNKMAGKAIQLFDIQGATDITGFGLGGHLLEMAIASKCSIILDMKSLPLMKYAYDLARIGLIPAGSYANKHFCHSAVMIKEDVDALLVDLVFDAQTSGGLVLGVPESKTAVVQQWLRNQGETAEIIGCVEPSRGDGKRLVLC